jgi:hypothetical protein
VLLAQRYLTEKLAVAPDDNKKHGGKRTDGASVREIAAFLGEENWSKDTVSDALLLAKLAPQVLDKIAPIGTTHPSRDPLHFLLRVILGGVSKKHKKHKRQKPNQSIAKTTKPTPSPSPTTTPSASPSSGRPHVLTIIFSVIGIVLASTALYWGIAQPDIRYIPSLGPEAMTLLESKVDGAGNFVHSIRLRPTFTNYSFKPGFVDKAEFVPQSIATLPEFKVTGINKTFIFWHQEKQIEITFLMTIPTDPVNHLNTTRELAVDQVLAAYDNTGKKIDHLPSGLLGRIRFNFKELVDTRLQDVR